MTMKTSETINLSQGFRGVYKQFCSLYRTSGLLLGTHVCPNLWKTSMAFSFSHACCQISTRDLPTQETEILRAHNLEDVQDLELPV